jgi:cytoplasmic iron level regulating protein YaaA (DUF328/UPF0246 family)
MYFKESDLLFEEKHRKLMKKLKRLKKADLKRIMKIDNELLDETNSNIKNYESNKPFQAFYSFNGLVFKNLKRDSYKEEELLYIEKHVRILDAMYGVIKPSNMIKPYRLDMKMKIGVNLYEYWDISEYFKDEVVVNLASDEFSKKVNGKMITISFLQNKEGKFVNQATYSKMARGMMLDYMIEKKIEDINEMKKFDRDGYLFNRALSNSSLFVFTR